jgi:geranylgeranyl pyrophosphate synthase
VKCFQGLAYQLVDDALDFTGTQASLGKPALSDLGQVSIFMFFVKCRICAYV